MKGMKKTIGIVLVIALIAVGIYTFVAVKSETSSEKVQLRMAHGQAADSEIGETIEYLSDLAAEDSSKNLEVDIYPSGVLGAEPSTVEMVQAGVLDMAKVSANTLGQFDERYSIFSLPYCLNASAIGNTITMQWQTVKEFRNCLNLQGTKDTLQLVIMQMVQEIIISKKIRQ